MLVETSAIGASLFALAGLSILGCCCSQEQQQQMQVLTGDDDEPQRVCPECGMENPRDANHCGDCGFSFKSRGED